MVITTNIVGRRAHVTRPAGHSGMTGRPVEALDYIGEIVIFSDSGALMIVDDADGLLRTVDWAGTMCDGTEIRILPREPAQPTA